MKAGLIGNGYHSKRIQEILKRKNINFFLYKPSRPNYYNIEDFEKIKKCDVIFIITPNKTHLDYIKKLYSKRYIFCEKPPVNSIKDLKNLKKINSKKIYFNYNFRFSKISQILEKRDQYKVGKLIYANLITSHGLALKEEYKNNWRSNLKKSPKGVYEVISIHWIDLINFHFNINIIKKPKLLNHSGIGNSFDTSLVEIITSDSSLVNVFSTYNSAYSKRLFFLFENGIIEQYDNIVSVRGPAINLDKRGFFKKPKLIESYKVDENNDYNISLEKSVTFFLSKVKKKEFFNKKLFDCALKSNSLIL
jgi:predicted dehydrogenase